MPRVGLEPIFSRLRPRGYWDRPSEVYCYAEVMGFIVPDQTSLNPQHLLLNNCSTLLSVRSHVKFSVSFTVQELKKITPNP